MNDTKIFLTGTSRGGTSLVARMLSANKQINVTIEFLMEILRLQRNLVLKKLDKKKYAFNLTAKLPFQDYYYSDESINALDSVVNSSGNLKLPKKVWKKHSRIIKKRWSVENKDLIKSIDKIYNPSFKKLINNCFAVIKNKRNLKKKKIMGFLDSWVIEMFLPLAKNIKNSKFIIIIRDPRASMASNLNVWNKRNIPNSMSFLKCWRKMIALTIYYKTLKIFKNRLYVLTHEDLIKNPKKVCKGLCKFLNVKFESEMLNTRNYINYSTGKIWKGNSTFEKKAFGFSKKRTNRWKKNLSYGQIKAAEFIAHHEMKLLNYKFYKSDNFSKLKDGLAFLMGNDNQKIKWKTGNKTTELNYGVEFFRKHLFDDNSIKNNKKLLRRLFLFDEVYKKIKKNKSIFRSN